MKIIKSSKNVVLIVVSHTDDETIGMGGTIARHLRNGDEIFALSMTDGVGSRSSFDSKKKEARLEAALQASKVLGFKWLENLNYQDNKLDSVPLLKIIKEIEKVKDLIKPNLIYTHSSADLNIDHRVVNQAVLTSFRPEPEEVWNEIRTFEISSSTDYGHKSVTNYFTPNLYIDITDYWDSKLEALKKYSMEIRDYPHSRSYKGIENLAIHRGNQVGLKYAESFEVIRKIIR